MSDDRPILERDGLISTVLLAAFAVVAWVAALWPRPHPWACRACHRTGPEVIRRGERVVGLLCSECARSAA